MSKELIGSNREIVGSPAHFTGTLRCSRGDDFARSLESLVENRWYHLFQPNLAGIVREIELDLEQGLRDNDYIRDENADNLRATLKQLERCGVRCYSLDRTVDDLAWFVGGDADKIRQLQQKLNELGVGERLEEDGVFGIKTLTALNLLHINLERGMFPALVKIDPLQSDRTGIKSVPINGTSSLQDFSARSNNNGKGIVVFRADTPHPKQGIGYHINTVEGKGLKKGNICPVMFKGQI